MNREEAIDLGTADQLRHFHLGEESMIGPPHPEQDRARELLIIKRAAGDLLEVFDTEKIECGSCVGKMTEKPDLLVCGNPSHVLIALKVKRLKQLIASK